jgi:hypothetical protein
MGERFEIGVLLTFSINTSYVTRQIKQIKGAIWYGKYRKLGGKKVS